MYMCFFSSSFCAFSKRKRVELVSKHWNTKKTGRREKKARDGNFIEKEKGGNNNKQQEKQQKQQQRKITSELTADMRERCTRKLF